MNYEELCNNSQELLKLFLLPARDGLLDVIYFADGVVLALKLGSAATPNIYTLDLNSGTLNKNGLLENAADYPVRVSVPCSMRLVGGAQMI
mgnify:CR=1 FL=1